jgi:hypothetical protein
VPPWYFSHHRHKAGIALGLRFNVMVLIPAMVLAAAVTIASGRASGMILLALF